MTHIGREIRRLRIAREWTQTATAIALQVTQGHLHQVEAGKKTCGAPLALRAADLFELTGDAREAFLAKREEIPTTTQEELPAPAAPNPKRLPMARVVCRGGCDHDGRLAPGGSDDGRERDSKCAHYAGCSLAFVKAHKDARTSHCPKDCPQQAYHTAPEKATEGWGSFAFPG